MSAKNTTEEYGWVAITFHWVIAALIFFQLALGLFMVDLPTSLKKLRMFGLHKEFGLLILFLAMLRLTWRLANIQPRLPATVPAWQNIAAHTVHAALYASLFFIPITGWLISSAAGLPISFFGLFLMPPLIGANETLQFLFGEIHTWLAYLLILLICLHSGAALQHHFINKDNILRRMFY